MAVEFEKNGARQECRWMSVLIPPIECPLACVMSVSNLWNLAQYELKQTKKKLNCNVFYVVQGCIIN